MARKVRQMRRKGKDVGLVPAPVTTAPDIDARVALIQALIPVALDKVMEELQADVERLAGGWYAREGRLPGHVRWTRQRGSVYLGEGSANQTDMCEENPTLCSHRRFAWIAVLEALPSTLK